MQIHSLCSVVLKKRRPKEATVGKCLPNENIYSSTSVDDDKSILVAQADTNAIEMEELAEKP